MLHSEDPAIKCKYELKETNCNKDLKIFHKILGGTSEHFSGRKSKNPNFRRRIIIITIIIMVILPMLRRYLLICSERHSLSSSLREVIARASLRVLCNSIARHVLRG